MTALRHLLFERRLLAGAIVALAMFLKILVPAGFMIGTVHGAIAIEVCPGHHPMAMADTMPKQGHHGDKSDHQGKEMPCAFSGLTAPSLAAADPVLLVLAIAFIIATIFRAETQSVAPRLAYLRPPLRGPPAHA